LSKMSATPLRRSVTLQLAHFAGLCSLDTDAYNSAAYNPVGCRCSVVEAGYTTVEVQCRKMTTRGPVRARAVKNLGFLDS
jgi:hypothetical protein